MLRIYIILTRIKFYILFKLNPKARPSCIEFQRLSKSVQINWIAQNYVDFEDIFPQPEGWLGMSYPEGVIHLEDYQKYPDDYGVVFKLQDAGLEIDEKREKEINNGEPLTKEEEDALIASVAEDDVDSWIGHHGFEIALKDGSLFTHFTGHSMGQGGVDFRYEAVFNNKAALIDYIGEQFLASFQV